MIGESRTINILLVEDDVVDVKAFKRLLHKQNILNPVFYASDGIEALDFLRSDAEKLNISDSLIVVLDLNMPRMNGIEFLTALRRDPKLREIPVVIRTTSDNHRDLAASLSLEASAYIQKNHDEILIDTFKRIGVEMDYGSKLLY